MIQSTQSNKTHNDLFTFLNIETLNNSIIKDKLYKKLINSLIPKWVISYGFHGYNNPSSEFITQTMIEKYTKKNITDSQYKHQILTSFNLSNEINDSGKEDLTNEMINKIYDLYKLGLTFHFKDSLTQIIPITKNDILFPICDVGKNRSQYMFYFFKNLQTNFPNTFMVGYPSSADEMASIFDISAHNQSILSSFSVGYKSDNFSESLYKDNKDTKSSYPSPTINPFPQVSRSIHIFDSILKEKEQYSIYDLKNYEKHKYRNNKYDIFDKNNKDLANIKELYKKYFLTPQNLIKIINNNLVNKTNYQITYICMSTQSFITMCNILYSMTKFDELIDLSNVKIVYFALKDIFQRSTINQKILYEFRTKINSSFRYVDIEQ